MKRFIRGSNIAITGLVAVVIVALFYAPAKIAFLEPMTKALSDFQLTDLEFSKLRDQNAVTGDTDIVLVNISSLNRKDIARMVNALTAAHPKVIGIDAFFRKPKTEELDTPLVSALSNVSSLVVASELKQWNQNALRFDSLAVSNPKFTRRAYQGFANMVIDADEGFRTARTFSPQEHVGDSIALSFDALILKLYDSTAYAELMQRGNTTEIINYRGNLDKFFALDTGDVLAADADLSSVRGKIVLMGYLGPTLGTPSLEDVFFTPLNVRYAGKTFPDMYGVAVHANIISMALHRDYIGTMPLWQSVLLALILCHLHAVLFSFIQDRYERWFDAITMFIQLGETVLSLVAIVVVFEKFQFKLDITLALVAMVLCGTMFELYHSLIHKTFSAVSERITGKSKRVA